MFCGKCGKENKKDAAFCAYCGARLSTDAERINQEKENVSPVSNGNPNAITKPKKKTKTGVIVAIVLGVTICIIGIIVGIFALISSKYKKIDIQDYIYKDVVNITQIKTSEERHGLVLSGFNHEATLVEFDSSLFNMDQLEKDCQLYDTSEAYSYSDAKDYANFQQKGIINSAIKYELDLKDDQKLSNGDKVNLIITWNDEALKKANIKIKQRGEKYVYTYTVKGLIDPTEIDPLSMIIIVPQGISGSDNAKLQVKATKKEKIFGDFLVKYENFESTGAGTHVYFQVFKGKKEIAKTVYTWEPWVNEETIKNGSAITFKLDKNNYGQFEETEDYSKTEEKYGFKTIPEEKQFKISNMPHYIQEDIKLNKNQISQLKKIVNNYWKTKPYPFFNVIDETKLGNFVCIELSKNESNDLQLYAVYEGKPIFGYPDCHYIYVKLTFAVFDKDGNITINSDYISADPTTDRTDSSLIISEFK